MKEKACINKKIYFRMSHQKISKVFSLLEILDKNIPGKSENFQGIFLQDLSVDTLYILPVCIGII